LLTIQEQSLIRGWIAHLGWPMLGQLYLNDPDIAETRQTVLLLRQRLALKARRCRRPDLSAFWLAERRPGAEWAGKAERALRNLLEWPEPQPARGDPVDQWFADRLAVKLSAAGLATLEDLIDRRGRAGPSWWQSIPNLGGHSAQTIERFLKAHAEPLGLADGMLVVCPSATPAARAENPAIQQLFDGKPDLSGALGRNRAPADRCRIEAHNDFEAIQAWLNLRDRHSHTYRAYRKEAERWLLWALSELGKPLSSLTTPDCKAYRDFLFAPSEPWLRQDFKPRWSTDWRPFKGPLKQRNVRHTETILGALCEWLVKQRYLDSNPFDGLPPLPNPQKQALQVERALDEEQWQGLLDYCALCEAEPPQGRAPRDYRRIWIALQLAYCTGLRLAELAGATFGDLRYKSRNGGQWWLSVLGKGSRQREVPLPDELVAELKQYAKERGVTWGIPDSSVPIIGKFRQTAVIGTFELDYVERPFTASGLHRVLKTFFLEAAERMRREDHEHNQRQAERLLQVTAHWLRHTHASHAINRGMPLILVKENLGHASLNTTSIYLHGDKDQRHQEMEKLYRGKRAVTG
jgi:integrase